METMIVLAIIAILSTAALTNFFGSRNKADLDGVTQQIAALLREAQSDSMAQSQGVSWGVHLENPTTATPFYSLFASSTYSTSTVVGYYRLPASVGYLTSTLAQGSAINITFSALNGTASASTTIRLYSRNAASLSSTISVASSGAVIY